MRTALMSLFVALLTTLLGCKEEGHCFYNCPDEPTRICGEKVMGPNDDPACEALAEQKCNENPEHLTEWGGKVQSQIVICKQHDVCGIPDWCLPGDVHIQEPDDSQNGDAGPTIVGEVDSGMSDSGANGRYLEHDLAIVIHLGFPTQLPVTQPAHAPPE